MDNEYRISLLQDLVRVRKWLVDEQHADGYALIVARAAEVIGRAPNYDLKADYEALKAGYDVVNLALQEALEELAQRDANINPHRRRTVPTICDN
jgi:hypothetical protein